MAESLHCSPETITTLFIVYPAIQNKKFKETVLESVPMAHYREIGLLMLPIVWEKEKGEYDFSFERSRITQLAEHQPHTSRDFPIFGWLEFNLLLRLPGFPELSGKVIMDKTALGVMTPQISGHLLSG